MTELELRHHEPTVTLTHGQLQQIRETATRQAELTRIEQRGTSRVVAIVLGVMAGLFMLLTFAMGIFKMFMASMEAQAARNHELAMKAVEQSTSSAEIQNSMFLGAGIVIFVICFVCWIVKLMTGK
ncbi:MAG: hypothetical protein ACR2RE_03065 [Geminicoccaceae bacterium]